MKIYFIFLLSINLKDYFIVVVNCMNLFFIYI